jgi:hypothetical protein
MVWLAGLAGLVGLGAGIIGQLSCLLACRHLAPLPGRSDMVAGGMATAVERKQEKVNNKNTKTCCMRTTGSMIHLRVKPR